MPHRSIGMILLTVFILTISGLELQAKERTVTIALVTPDKEQLVSIESRQALWKSPFGGWVVTAWSFALRVDDQAILEYQTASEKLLADTGLDTSKADDEGLDEMIGEITGRRDDVRAEDLVTFRLNRQASAKLVLAAGRHVIEPFGIGFTVAGDGSLATRDARLRVNSKAGRVEVICHPVAVTTFAGARSVSAPLRFSCASANLLGNLNKVLAEHESKSTVSQRGPGKSGFRRVTLYLPASTPEKPYKVNGVRFELDAKGQIKVAANARASSPRAGRIH